MRQPRLATLLRRDFQTLTPDEQLRVMVACAQVLARPPHRLRKAERPRCGARCRDGHPCQARATVDAETGCFVRNGRCRLHGGLSTGPRTVEGRRRCRDAVLRHAQQRRRSHP
jgi:hypothetical protein